MLSSSPPPTMLTPLQHKASFHEPRGDHVQLSASARDVMRFQMVESASYIIAPRIRHQCDKKKIQNETLKSKVVYRYDCSTIA